MASGTVALSTVEKGSDMPVRSVVDRAAAAVPAFALDRPALAQRLERAMAKRLVLLVAPAGYGKTVLLAQWALAHPERRVVWVGARAREDAPTLGRRLAEALDEVRPGAAGRILPLLGPTTALMGPAAIDALVAELEEVTPIAVVIEDFEAITGIEAREEVVELAAKGPVGTTVVVASRHDAFPGVEALRVRDEVAEIRQAVLELTAEEGAELVVRMGGPALAPSEVEALHSRTEGWAAGVQLAALGLRDHEDPEGFVVEFTGDDRHVADYLGGEVLARQPAGDTDFLVLTSVLDRLSGSLCDAVTGRSDGQRSLERLAAQSLFLRPLDRRREWFGYHPLFQELLRYELRAGQPEREAALLGAAADWHLAHGAPAEAAEYLMRAGDWDRLIALAKAEGGGAFARGEPGVAVRWLEAVPPEHLFREPDGAIVQASLLTMAGRSLAAEDLLARLGPTDDLAPYQRAEIATIASTWSGYHGGRPERAAEAAAEVADLDDRDLERPGGPLLDVYSPAAMRSVTGACVGIAVAMAGDYAAARPPLQHTVDDPGSAVWQVHALSELAWIDASTGHLRRALAGARRAHAVAEEVGLAQHPAAALAHVVLARVHRMRGEVTAVDHLEVGLALAQRNQRSRTLCLEWGERAEAAVADGRLGDGLAVLEGADGAGRHPIAPAEKARLVGLRARLLSLAGDPEGARQALESPDLPLTHDLSAAAAFVAAASRDVAALRKVVDGWDPVDAVEPAARRARGLWSAVLADLEGDRRGALTRLREVVVDVEAEGDVRLLLDGGTSTARLVRALYHDHPTPFLRRLVEGALASSSGSADGLVEPLTERELTVLRYLPSRLSNADIAERLYVSVNTLKTHVKNIYRKLDAGDRSEAIERAEELGLL